MRKSSVRELYPGDVKRHRTPQPAKHTAETETRSSHGQDARPALDVFTSRSRAEPHQDLHFQSPV